MNLRLKIAGAVSTIALLATATSAIAQEIRVWTTETQPARLERQQKMAADYEASTGVKVQMIPVEESDYGTRATAAFAAGDLPDVIYIHFHSHCLGRRQVFWTQKLHKKYLMILVRIHLLLDR